MALPLPTYMEKRNKMHQKAHWFTALLLVLVALAGYSCKMEMQDEFDQGVNAPLALSASKGNLVLQEKQAASEAVAFTWTTGSNYGTNASIAYKLYLDKQGNNFRNAVVVDMGKTAFQQKYSVKELNDLLLSRLKLPPGVEATLEAKVVSYVSGTDISDSTTTQVKVTPYLPVTTTLYLLGDAAPNGWSANDATPITMNT
jgi:starch-binding outer membrane protein SusE/F